MYEAMAKEQLIVELKAKIADTEKINDSLKTELEQAKNQLASRPSDIVSNTKQNTGAIGNIWQAAD